LRGRWHLGHRLILPIKEGVEVRRKAVVNGKMFSLGMEL
jgi:hypothetical protein